MSKIALASNVDGTGTFTLASPNSNSDRTLNLPDNSGTVLTTGSTFAGTGPAFSATLAPNQNVTNNTITKVQLSVEQFDTNSCFDSTTNYRFTPTVAGYYLFTYAVRGGLVSGNNVQAVNGLCEKNGQELGSTFLTGSFMYPTAVGQANSTGSVIYYLNGSTDYVELYGKVVVTSGSPYFDGAYLTGALVRAA
jgi:hypothetical protein